MAGEQHLQERISTLLGRILDLPGDSIAGDAHLMNDLGGDSWQYLEFRTELERVFNIIIPDAEVDRLEPWTNVHNSSGSISTGSLPQEHGRSLRVQERRRRGRRGTRT